MKIPLNNTPQGTEDPTHPQGTFRGKLFYCVVKKNAKDEDIVRFGWETSGGNKVFNSVNVNKQGWRLKAINDALGISGDFDTDLVRNCIADLVIKHSIKKNRDNPGQTMLFYDISVHPAGSLIKDQPVAPPMQQPPQYRSQGFQSPPVNQPRTSYGHNGPQGGQYGPNSDTPF